MWANIAIRVFKSKYLKLAILTTCCVISYNIGGNQSTIDFLEEKEKAVQITSEYYNKQLVELQGKIQDKNKKIAEDRKQVLALQSKLQENNAQQVFREISKVKNQDTCSFIDSGFDRVFIDIINTNPE